MNCRPNQSFPIAAPIGTCICFLLLYPSWLLGQSKDFEGLWRAGIESPGGTIGFGLELKRTEDGWRGFLRNGDEQIEIPEVRVDKESLHLGITHYDSKITAKLKDTGAELIGQWRKRRGSDEWVEMEFAATRPLRKLSDSPAPFIGRWAVKFESSDDPAVAILKSADQGRVEGTFLTTTGDYRYLDGVVENDELTLSCFDGAHAFLFRAELVSDSEIKGDFWSSNTWHESWTAKKDENAKLPNAFEQTVANPDQLSQLSFPDLNGDPKQLNAAEFQSNARIIYVFGSWCPNCHDAAQYFSELQNRFGDRGLKILGLAFELTGEFERDANQVRKYLKRHGSEYPVLIAGLADKNKASAVLPLLDRVRSYPTTIFIDRHDQIRAVHTGFSGPATGSEYQQLKNKFESLIESMLDEQ